MAQRLQALREDLGKKFGRLTVVDGGHWRPYVNPSGYKFNLAYLRCICECGRSVEKSRSELRKGTTKSCGCFRVDVKTTHGETSKGQRTAEYSVWASMASRCYNKNTTDYRLYGGKGITVCDRWRNSYENFLADMGRKPSPSSSIDRIDSNGNYEKDNCRWASAKVQARNTSRNTYFEFQGGSKTLAEWSEITGIKYRTLVGRIKVYGWSVEKSLSTVSLGRGSNQETYR